ncbi:binding-protein-dependent transporter inner membrane component [Jeotgalibacillus malaysiensis]|uniref:Binding-protein-dependent transporter inner membrane component n=1 Tax=Jeotgalibacillus malaysiensis TaxID=1508404 RepID=A0A0B5AN00_9BACL|nr:ABC transporter permease [Jeotgalibacillus malaysiensis]AJD90042.1 binding-protein-dependent transporter inner membrane component [Jeotgalibacillus malaysiensis]
MKNKLNLIALGLILPVVLIAVWEAAARLGWIESYLLPAPTVVVTSIIEMAQEGTLWAHVSITLYRVGAGFLIGTAAALFVGAAVGYFKQAERLLDPILQAFRSIPSLAWVPLFLLWMGIGEPSKVTLIAVGVFFPVYLNIVSGIQGVDRKLIEVGKVYRFSSLQLVRRIILPASLPSFLVGIRSGLGLGWMFVVAAELLGASEGLGYLLVLGQNTSSPELIIASIILFAALGKGTDALLKGIEAKSLKWQDNLQNAQ